MPLAEVKGGFSFRRSNLGRGRSRGQGGARGLRRDTAFLPESGMRHWTGRRGGEADRPGGRGPGKPEGTGKMKKGCMVWAIVVGGLVLVALLIGSFFFGRYNTMVQMEERVNESWAQVENVYQRRLDLIPNLVETVKGVASFERETFIAVTEARAKAGQVQIGADTVNNPEAFRRFQEAQDQLTGALSRLLVTVERYPELKANQNFLELQSQLEGTENRIAVERSRFNEAAREFNALIRIFPNSIVAQIAGFKPKAYFQAAEGAERAPKVEF